MLFPPRGPVAFIPHVRARVCVRAITKGGREVGAGGEREREREGERRMGSSITKAETNGRDIEIIHVLTTMAIRS